MPKSLARKRIWNKKYPICIELGRQDDFMSKAQPDKETSEEKPPAERELGGEDPKKPPHPQERTRSGQRDQILYLFGRTGREKEEWFQRFILASKLKSDIKKPPGVSGSKPGDDTCTKCLCIFKGPVGGLREIPRWGRKEAYPELMTVCPPRCGHGSFTF